MTPAAALRAAMAATIQVWRALTGGASLCGALAAPRADSSAARRSFGTKAIRLARAIARSSTGAVGRLLLRPARGRHGDRPRAAGDPEPSAGRCRGGGHRHRRGRRSRGPAGAPDRRLRRRGLTPDARPRAPARARDGRREAGGDDGPVPGEDERRRRSRRLRRRGARGRHADRPRRRRRPHALAPVRPVPGGGRPRRALRRGGDPPLVRGEHDRALTTTNVGAPMSLRFTTAGESHGPGLVAIVEGMPAGLELSRERIDREMARRQLGHGRGGRMKIERDTVEVRSGVRHGRTLGSPIALLVANRDYANWEERMNPWPVDADVDEVHTPRPGHADLAGLLKYGHTDVRNVLERASARETAARVAAGAVAKELLRAFGVSVHSHVLRIGSVSAPERDDLTRDDFANVDDSPVRCLDPAAGDEMVAEIDRLRKANESLGGTFEVRAFGLVPGLGSHVSWAARLDARLAAALGSIEAVKGVSVGEAWEVAARPGSESHDEIFFDADRGWHRRTNRAGGIEGGMSNGEPLVVRAALKPISTLTKPLRSVDTETHEAAQALRERTDSTVVPAAGVVGEAMVALVLAACYREKFGGDHLDDALAALAVYRERIGWRR